jgi:hypothetical protein
MTKIVYNLCFGGFGISREAVLRGRELSGDPRWGGLLKGEAYVDGSVCDHDYNSLGSELERTDPTLVRVVEELGDKANGMGADLRIADLPPGTPYRIDEYDGRERVETHHSYDWKVA